MMMEFLLGKMFYLIVILVSGTMAKNYADTDLTLNIASTVYDQYPWSMLPPHKGPTVQDTLEWKWTATDRSEKGPIDKFLQSPWKKSSLLPTKHNSRSMSSSKKIEDKGPGSMEIYRLTNIDDSELNLITNWKNPELRKEIMKNESPKKLSYTKNFHKIEMKKDNLPIHTTKMTNKIIKIDELINSQGVPELQIGCEGLEAPIELPNREQRSISMNNDTNKDDYTYIGSLVPPITYVNPVTIDWDYDSKNEHRNYDEMDELLKLKKLQNKKIEKNRGDIVSDDDNIEYDFKKVPLRGDLVGSRKVRSILDAQKNTKAIRRNNHGPWGFGEDDGYILENDDDDDDDDDDDSDNSAQRIEADRRRQEYERMQREEMEKRRTLMIERRRERLREDEMRRNDNELSEIDIIRKEYENRQSVEQREQERKLREYIERNRPIVIENHDDRNRRVQEEFRRRTEATRNNVPVKVDHSRGPSPPASYPSTSRADDLRRRHEDEARRRQEDEAQRRQEEYLRRKEEERRVADVRRAEEGRLRLRQDQISDYPNRRLEDERRNEEEYLRQWEEEARLRLRQNQVNDNLNRRLEEERRREEARRRVEEERRRQNQTNNDPNGRLLEERRREAERRKVEEERLRARPNQPNYNLNRRLEDERRREEEYRRIQSQNYEEDRRHRLMEQKKKEIGVISLDQAERRTWEEKRLNLLPVRARILLIPNSSRTRSSNTSTLFPSRGNFDNDVDLPAINPNRPGLSASRFPAAPTPKPPSNSPGSCVWAIVQCCPNSDQRRLSNCFEHMGCPGVNWDPSPCRDSIANAARAEVVRYYGSAD